MRLVWPTRGRRRICAAERVPTSIVERASQWPPASFTTIDRIGRSQSSWCHAHPGRTCCWIACTAIPLQQLLRMRAAPKLYGSRLPRSTGPTPSIEPLKDRSSASDPSPSIGHRRGVRFEPYRYHFIYQGVALSIPNARIGVKTLERSALYGRAHLKPWKVPCRIPVMFMATRERPSLV